MQNQKLLNIIKFITFILLMRGHPFFIDTIYNITGFIFDSIIEKIIPNIFGLFYIVFYAIFISYLKAIFQYFVAKKFGVVQFLNKFPFITALLIVILMDIIILARPGWYNNYDHYQENPLEFMLVDFFFGLGFIYTFFTYKFAKFLSRKFKRFKFLEKLYPRKLEKIPNVYLLGFTTLFAYPYLKYATKYGFNFATDGSFYISLILFFVIIAIFFTVELIKTIKKKIAG